MEIVNNEIIITSDKFRTRFTPAFDSIEKYPDAIVDLYIKLTKCHISHQNCGILHGECRGDAIKLLTAHMLTIRNKTLASGGQGQLGVVTQATLDQISLSYQVPPVNTANKAWWFSTPYGMEYYTLLMAKAPAPFYMFGTPQRVFKI